MARLPSYLMWDDHDLIDGFGSRPEQFNKLGIEADDWKLYREYLTNAFYEFQACRNPNWSNLPNGPFSFSQKIGNKGFIVLDLRSERNFILKKLINEEHKEEIEKKVDELLEDKVDTIFFVSPVTITRMGDGVEILMGKISNYLWHLLSWLGYQPSIFKPLVWWLLASISFLTVQMSIDTNQSSPLCMWFFSFCLINIIADLTNNANYFSKKHTRNMRAANYTIILGILIYQRIWTWNPVNFISTLEIVIREVVVAGIYSWTLLITSLITILLLYCSSLQKVKTYPIKFLAPVIKKVGYFSLVFSIIFITWLGMPGEEFRFKLILLFTVQIAAIFLFLLGVLEALGTIDMIAGLDDDIADALSSEANEQELKWFQSVCKKIQNKNVKVVVLTGDIHTGGISKLSFDRNFEDPNKIIYQIVSSPISYVPMSHLVEKLTTNNTVIEMPKNSGGFYTYNSFYRCERNFVVIRISKNTPNLLASFYFEDVKSPEVVNC